MACKKQLADSITKGSGIGFGKHSAREVCSPSYVQHIHDADLHDRQDSTEPALSSPARLRESMVSGRGFLGLDPSENGMRERVQLARVVPEDFHVRDR